MRAPRRPELAFVVLLVTVVAGGTWFVHGLSAERREAQARWDERGPTSYSYSYFSCGGMCANCPVDVTVRDGRLRRWLVGRGLRGPQLTTPST